MLRTAYYFTDSFKIKLNVSTYILWWLIVFREAQRRWMKKIHILCVYVWPTTKKKKQIVPSYIFFDRSPETKTTNWIFSLFDQNKNVLIFYDVGWKHARKVFPWKSVEKYPNYTYNYHKKKNTIRKRVKNTWRDKHDGEKTTFNEISSSEEPLLIIVPRERERKREEKKATKQKSHKKLVAFFYNGHFSLIQINSNDSIIITVKRHALKILKLIEGIISEKKSEFRYLLLTINKRLKIDS